MSKILQGGPIFALFTWAKRAKRKSTTVPLKQRSREENNQERFRSSGPGLLKP
jgi:hypothetical protein